MSLWGVAGWLASREPRRRAKVLELLADGREWYGLGLVTKSGGVLKRGTIYVTLFNLENAGLITSRRGGEATELGRRLYSLPTGSSK